MKIIEDFCRNLADHENWGYGYNVSIKEYCSFYYNDPNFRLSVEVDKSRGNEGYLTPEPKFDYEWIGVMDWELEKFLSGERLLSTLTNAKWIKIELYYGDQIVYDTIGLRLDNEKVDIAFPDYNNGKWYFDTTHDIKGINYYISVLLGNGQPTIDRNGVLPKNVIIR